MEVQQPRIKEATLIQMGKRGGEGERSREVERHGEAQRHRVAWRGGGMGGPTFMGDG